MVNGTGACVRTAFQIAVQQFETVALLLSMNVPPHVVPFSKTQAVGPESHWERSIPLIGLLLPSTPWCSSATKNEIIALALEFFK
jgi:hypothetical protein